MVETYLFDSSAWIEYFLGTPLGEKTKKLLEGPDNILVPNIVLAEVSSKLTHFGLDLSRTISTMKNCLPAIEEREYFVEAGILHAEARRKNPSFGLADAIILVLAEKNRAKIVTKDHHLKGKNTIML